MYKCDIHGDIGAGWKTNFGWCLECKKEIQCDCTDLTATRWKLRYDCEDGNAEIKIYLDHCASCGEPKNVRYE